MAMTFKKRLLAILLCLVFVLCVVVQPVFADPIVLPSATTIALIGATLLTGLGIMYASDEDFRNGTNAFVSTVMSAPAELDTLKTRFVAACMAYEGNGLAGLNSVLKSEDMKLFMQQLISMGYQPTDETKNIEPIESPFGYSGEQLMPEVRTGYDVLPVLGDHFVVLDSQHPPYVWSKPYFTSSGINSSGDSVGVAHFPFCSLAEYQSNPALLGSHEITTVFEVSYLHHFQGDVVASDFLLSRGTYNTIGGSIVVYDTDTGKVYNFNPSMPPNAGQQGPKQFIPLAIFAATLASIAYRSQQDVVQEKLNKLPADQPVNFTSVTEPVGNKHYTDVITYPAPSDTSSDVTSSDPTSSDGSSLPAGDPITIGGLQTLFIPAPDYLSRKFGTMLTAFPDLGDLEELRRLTSLGERKPEFPLELNNYFGITTRQDGINVDVWDDKRDVFRPWIKGFIIILTIIYNFNMVYKLVRGGIFSDAGSGARGGAGVKKDGEG